MSLIAKKLCNKKTIHLRNILSAPMVRHCHFFPDYKPGPYPKTQEEREKAAKKYNLLIEEYEPYPDDGNGCGDYPKLPIVSVDCKDPYHNWDFKPLRRDYLEPVPFEFILYLPERLSTKEEPITRFKALSILFSFAAIVMGTLLYVQKYICVTPVCEKQYPQPGVVHYTFEIDEEEAERRRRAKCVCP